MSLKILGIEARGDNLKINPQGDTISVEIKVGDVAVKTTQNTGLTPEYLDRKNNWGNA